MRPFKKLLLSVVFIGMAGSLSGCESVDNAMYDMRQRIADERQLLHPRQRQRPREQGVEKTEYTGVRADAQREREDRDGGEPRRALGRRDVADR